MSRDTIDGETKTWLNGDVMILSVGAAEETRHGSFILATEGDHAVAGVKAYEKIVVRQTATS